MTGSDNVTIIDVASQAGVSVTTVSRFLNNHFESMSESTRKRITDVVEELEYRPNKLARSLKSQNSMTLGCVVADMASPFSSVLIKGIDCVCKKNGYSLLIADSDNDASGEVDAVKNLISNPVCGLIINTTGKNADFIVNISKSLPVVLADRCLMDDNTAVDTVTTDNEESTYTCMEYLKRQGYQRVAFFTPTVFEISTRAERLAAYRKGMQQIWKTNSEEDLYFIDPSDDESVRTAFEHFIEKNQGEPLAIFCVNGVVTLKVLQVMKKLGIRVGDGIGICGFDDWGWADIIGPGITTIVPGTYDIGVKCAEMIIKRIKRNNKMVAKRVVLKNTFFERGSTKPEER